MNRLVRTTALLVLLTVALAAISLLSPPVAESQSRLYSLELERGWNLITWIGSEPYSLDNLANTPVTGINRFDNGTGKWLSSDAGGRFVLPEKHLLPGMPYFIEADRPYAIPASDTLQPESDDVTEVIGKKWNVISPSQAWTLEEFTESVEHPNDSQVVAVYSFDNERQRWTMYSPVVPESVNTLRHIAPYQPLFVRLDDRGTTPSQLPALNIRSYSPNHASPLEDLVVLRGEEHNLSVSARVDHARGDLHALWVVDGTVNHTGLESDEIVLIPGGHDRGMLYVYDDAGQLQVRELPRIVKLPDLDLPDMTYGVVAHIGRVPFLQEWLPDQTYASNWEAVEKALDLIAEAGFSVVRASISWSLLEPTKGTHDSRVLSEYDRLVDEVYKRGLELLVIGGGVPLWAAVYEDVYWESETVNPQDFADYMGFAAKRWPQIRYWQPRQEPNLEWFNRRLEADNLMEEVRASALAVWHANPNSVLISPGLAFFLEDCRDEEFCPVTYVSQYIAFPKFLQWMYDRGLKGSTDVIALNAYACPAKFEEHPLYSIGGLHDSLDRFRKTMKDNGDGSKHFWLTETGWSTVVPEIGKGATDEDQAQCIREILTAIDSRKDMSGAIVYNFEDKGDDPRDIQHNFGIVEHFADGQYVPKAAYYAIAEFLRARP